ncbi:MAG TPA: wax ester/triacylglycerol synthase family O-acyltransferase [Burkholderiales bacterium]|nr:wax ester/triacylglycerol synthase family O-acyltransferase [Burkholderiales bacterium]
MPRRERMSSVDTAWLRMDRATNRMAIVVVLVLDTPLDYEHLKGVLEARWLCYERFRMRPREELAGAWWEETPRFDLSRQLKRVRLPGRGGPDALKRFVGRLAPRPFDPRRPWWEFHLVEKYDGGSAVVVRIHHSYADGIALIGVLLSLTTESSEPRSTQAPERAVGATAQEDNDGLLAQLFEPVAGVASGALRLSGTVLEQYLALLRNPQRVIDYARIAGSVAAEIAQLATMPDDSRTRFKGRAGVAKAVAWTDPLPLEEVKSVGRVLECSVNDVLLSTVAGALRRYLVEKGDPAAGVELRAMVPVNLRSPGDVGRLGNRFGLVTLLLPVGIANPLARLYEVRRRMEALKNSYQPVIAFALLGLAGFLPRAAQQEMLDLLANKATAVMTNVPGPQQPLYIGGARLGQLMFWVPQSGDIGMGVSILSYNGAVQFGLITDAGRVPDPERVIAGFRPEFERLLLTVLMEPWDLQREPGLVERELAAAAKGSRRAGSRGGAPPARRAKHRPAGAAAKTR